MQSKCASERSSYFFRYLAKAMFMLVILVLLSSSSSSTTISNEHLDERHAGLCYFRMLQPSLLLLPFKIYSSKVSASPSVTNYFFQPCDVAMYTSQENFKVKGVLHWFTSPLCNIVDLTAASAGVVSNRSNSSRYTRNDHMIAVVRRGNCSFIHKSRVAAAGGFAGLIIVNTDNTIFPVGTWMCTIPVHVHKYLHNYTTQLLIIVIF